jgi:broad specificity phosphatase PhoE
MGYIFILRHGPTDKSENLQGDKFIKMLPNIKKVIGKYCGDNKIKCIFTSPVERCMDTSKLVAKKLDVKKVKEEDGLRRCDREKNEKCSDANKRARKYAKFIKKKLKYKHNIILVTHSSVYKKIVEELYGHDLPKTRLHKASLSIVDLENSKLCEFNIKSD